MAICDLWPDFESMIWNGCCTQFIDVEPNERFYESKYLFKLREENCRKLETKKKHIKQTNWCIQIRIHSVNFSIKYLLLVFVGLFRIRLHTVVEPFHQSAGWWRETFFSNRSKRSGNWNVSVFFVCVCVCVLIKKPVFKDVAYLTVLFCDIIHFEKLFTTRSTTGSPNIWYSRIFFFDDLFGLIAKRLIRQAKMKMTESFRGSKMNGWKERILFQ